MVHPRSSRNQRMNPWMNLWRPMVMIENASNHTLHIEVHFLPRMPDVKPLWTAYLREMKIAQEQPTTILRPKPIELISRRHPVPPGRQKQYQANRKGMHLVHVFMKTNDAFLLLREEYLTKNDIWVITDASLQLPLLHHRETVVAPNDDTNYMILLSPTMWGVLVGASVMFNFVLLFAAIKVY